MTKLILTSLAKELRHTQTEAEGVLWSKLRNKQLDGIKFRRQQPLGGYIVDFVSLDKKLIIEIDGGQHSEEQAIKQDGQRTKWLENEGYRVIRFWNNDVLENLEGVIMEIQEKLDDRYHPHLNPLPSRERKRSKTCSKEIRRNR